MKVGEQKLNGGRGALLCPYCRTIAAYGFDHPPLVVCWECHETLQSPQQTRSQIQK